MIIWKHRSTCASEYAEFTVGKMKVVVQDCDGDFSVWYITDGMDTVVENQEVGGFDPYHFGAAKKAAIAALIPLAKQRGLYTD